MFWKNFLATARKPLALCAAALALILGACQGDTIILQNLAPSNFPGSSVLDTSVADDGLAFSNNGQVSSVNDFGVYWNVNGTAILLFQAQSVNTGNWIFYASFFDGAKLTPPAQIRGENEDPAASVQDAQVLFLNTAAYERSGASTDERAAARARNGDAIVLFTRDDLDPPATADEDSNRRLFASYFDKSEAAKAASGTLIHGFETAATAVDFDHVRTGAGNDEDVSTIGFASDSLHGTHDFANGNPSDSGDATSFAYILFRKRQSTGGSTVDQRFQFVRFDLEQDGNAIDQQASASADTLNPPAAAGAFATADVVDSGLVVHNGHAIWRVQNLGAVSDDVVTDSLFTGTGETDILLGSDVTGNTDTVDLPKAADVYGADHGLTSLYAFFTERDFSNNSNGSRASDRDVMLAKIDDGGTTREIREIDAFTGLVDTTDGDSDGADLRPGDEGAVASNSVLTRINRTGEFITVLWRQVTSDQGDLTDNNATTDYPAKNDAVWAQAVQTRRTSTARAIANSVLAAAIKSPSLDSTGDEGTGDDLYQDDVESLAFQAELPWGQGFSNSGGAGRPDLGSAIQSDHLRMNWTSQQRADQAGAGNTDEQERLLLSGIVVTLDATGSAAPTAVLASEHDTLAEALVPLPGVAAGVGYDVDWNCGEGCNFGPLAVDRGDDAGNVNVYFFANGNNLSDDGAAGAFTEERLYAFTGGASSALVSSDGGADLAQAQTGSLQAVTVPASGNITGTNADWGGTRTHVYWTEYASVSGSAVVLAARSFEKAATAPDHVPALADVPAFLDNPSDGDLNQFLVVPAASGLTAGVYFDENGHLYYNETRTDASAYKKDAGLSAPDLVDNESDLDLSSAGVFLPPVLGGLSDSLAVWSKVDPAGDERILIRIHD
ncbi:MAG: hypothetical protein AB1405_05165 [Bdellovibrionota bacterium]